MFRAKAGDSSGEVSFESSDPLIRLPSVFEPVEDVGDTGIDFE